MQQTKMAENTEGTVHLRGLLRHASVEVTTGSGAQYDDLKEYFPRGTDVRVACLPNDHYRHTVAAAKQLHQAGFNPVPHVAARALESREALDDFLAGAVLEANVKRVLLIAGDLPRARGPFSQSMEILETGLLQKHGIRSISVAGHPEGHPAVAAAIMEKALREKIALARTEGLDLSIITQFCFEAKPVLDFIGRLRAEGIDVPVRVGVAGPANIMTLIKFGMRCGVGNSLRALRTRADIFGRLAADARPDEILNDVAGAIARNELTGIAGVHFYVFGGLRKTGQWLHTAMSGAAA